MPAINPLYALITILLITSIGQTLFASILLFLSKNGNQIANRFLSIFMLSLCVALTSLFLFDLWMKFLPHTILVYLPITFLLPPLLWFYIKTLTNPESKVLTKQVLVHMLPAIIVFLLLIPFYLLPGIEKLEWHYGRNDWYLQFSKTQNWTSMMMQFIKFMPIIQGLIYALISYQCLQSHKINIENQFSNIENISLKWLKSLVIACAGIYIFSLLAHFFDILKISNHLIWIMNVGVGCTLLSVFGYFGVTQRLIYDSNISGLHNLSATFTKSVDEAKYKSSSLSKNHVDMLYQELLTYMQSAKPYLHSELTINELAKQLNIQARDLSRIINQKSQKNFLEFVNTYRIEEAKIALLSKQNNTILELAMMVGFNSKSAFYDTFKRMAGTTPKHYQKMLEE